MVTVSATESHHEHIALHSNHCITISSVWGGGRRGAVAPAPSYHSALRTPTPQGNNVIRCIMTISLLRIFKSSNIALHPYQPVQCGVCVCACVCVCVCMHVYVCVCSFHIVTLEPFDVCIMR